MSNLDTSQISCGIAELYDLTSDPKEVLIEALLYEDYAYSSSYDPYYNRRERKHIREFDFSMITFSDIVGKKSRVAHHTANNHGEKLAAFIKKEKLGTVLASHITTNPNTKNRIRMWIWHVNHRATKRFMEKELKSLNA